MARYHINAQGNPGLCKAKHSCPFGGDNSHYPSKDEARQAYEASMSAWNPMEAIREQLDNCSDPVPGLRPVLERYHQLYGDPQVGRTRAVFFRGDKVIKVPLNWEGLTDNSNESRWNSEEIPIAQCHIIMEGDIPLLEMEKVTPAWFKYGEGPRWINWVDCAQVGYTSTGQLVAYDL